MSGRAGIKHAIEPLIVVCSILAYLIAISYDSDESYDSLVHENFVGITDSRGLPSFRAALQAAHNKRVYTAVATGFAKIRRFNTDVQFPLSDHADFKQAVEYIEASGAKEVLTVGGGADVFAENLKKQGYNSRRFVPWQRNLAVTPVVE